MTVQRSVYTPSELNREAKLHLEAGFGRIWIEGEVSNLSRPASGHLYFSLKDAKAQIRCALFRSNAAGLGFQPANGQQVLARGRLSLYEPRGDYQMILEGLEQAGEGRLRAAFEALKKKLESEGLFDPARKRALPSDPRRIAVVSSASGAVIRDIIHVLKRRWPIAAVRLYPVPVQGDAAAAAIVRALAAANQHGWGQAIIVARGGGSLEDLQAFNDEQVARAIAASGVPVISAVGHETDFSIADFVADLRAPTPSAAAELLTPDSKDLQRRFVQLQLQIQQRMQARLQRLGQTHDHFAQRLAAQHPGRKLTRHQQALQQLQTRLSHHGGRLVPARLERFLGLQQRLHDGAVRFVSQHQQRLAGAARTLNAVSPLPTLARGYAILSNTSDERVVDSVGQLKAGDPMVAQLADGRVYGTVDRLSDEQLLPEKPDSEGD